VTDAPPSRVSNFRAYKPRRTARLADFWGAVSSAPLATAESTKPFSTGVIQRHEITSPSTGVRQPSVGFVVAITMNRSGPFACQEHGESETKVPTTACSRKKVKTRAGRTAAELAETPWLLKWPEVAGEATDTMGRTNGGMKTVPARRPEEAGQATIELLPLHMRAEWLGNKRAKTVQKIVDAVTDPSRPRASPNARAYFANRLGGGPSPGPFSLLSGSPPAHDA